MKELLKKLAGGKALTAEEANQVFCALGGTDAEGASDAQVGAYLYSTSTRELHSAELVGGARFLREHMVRIPIETCLPGVETLDTCGTGGSGLRSFNTSTAVAFLCAAAGQYVMKHGNRGATSGCGSVDLLEALGVKFDLAPAAIARCCAETHFGFIFAPKHHPATARVARIRRELGIATIFNFLGPLANPAGAAYQLLGLSKRGMLRVIAEALLDLGAKRAMVVHGEDGLDEITLNGATLVCEVNQGRISEYRIQPEQFGFHSLSAGKICAGTPALAAQILHDIFSGAKSPHRDLVLLNAGAAFYVSGRCSSIADGVELARSTIDSGKAREEIADVVRVTKELAGE